MGSGGCKVRRVGVAVVMVVVWGGAYQAALAQAPATLKGAVTDDTGAVLPGATITILNTATALQREAVTNGDGLFELPPLPPGTYTLTAVLSSFTPYKSNPIELAAGQEMTLTIQMRVAPMAEQVTVRPELLGAGLSLNADIERTRDDPQPYVVFDRPQIERSGAADLQQLLKQRLTMNTTYGDSAQGATNTTGNNSSIDLRGLGTNQTLILVDGRRRAGLVDEGMPSQPDINGIPLAAIERIEVLPTTASAIYGGSATGGVVNIVLRRNYAASEVTAKYDNTFDTDSGKRRLDFATGFNLEGRKTHVMLSGSYADANPLTLRERSFTREYEAASFANEVAASPGRVVTPPFGDTPVIASRTSGNLQLKPELGGTDLGSRFTYVPYGYAGVATSGVDALIENAGQYNATRADTVQDNGGRRALVNHPTVEALNFAIRRGFGSRVRAFLEASGSNNIGHFDYLRFSGSVDLPADAPNNPFVQAVRVGVPITTTLESASESITRDRRLLGGVMVQLPRDWHVEADYTWNQSRSSHSGSLGLASALGAATFRAHISDGTIDVLRDTNAFPIVADAYLSPFQLNSPTKYTLRDATLRFAGPIASLPAGPPQITVLLERREELMGEQLTYYASGDSTTLYPNRSQTAVSAYLETRVPLVSDRNKQPWAQELEVQISVRGEEYETEGSTLFVDWPGHFDARPDSLPPVARSTNRTRSIDPMTALRWKPVQDLAIRASVGTGFLPPAVDQVFGYPSGGPVENLIDPRRGDSVFSLPTGSVVGGGNPNLTPEQSTSWSTGVIVTPRWVPSLRVSVDYTHIEKTDNISSMPGGEQAILNFESQFPDRVIRGPNVPDDPPGWAGPVIGLDNSLLNLSRSEFEAYDVQLDYIWDTKRFGWFQFFGVGSWMPHYRTQVHTDQPFFDNAGYRLGPLKFKTNGNVAWNRESWTLGWNTYHFDSYLSYAASDVVYPEIVNDAIVRQGNAEARVDAQTYHDIFGAYRFKTGSAAAGRWVSALFGGAEITLGIRNLFNTPPAREEYGYSQYADPRMRVYQISVRKAFGS